MRLIINLQDRVQQDSVRFWSERNVKFMHLPLTTGAVSSPAGRGSDSVPVRIDLMGETTYLADSMQFMLEYGCRLNPPGAWYLMPSFRGELADETHLNQFFHSEAEIPGGLEDVFSVAEAYLRRITEGALAVIQSPDHAHLNLDVAHLIQFLASPSIPRITMDAAVCHLGDDSSAVTSRDSYRTLTKYGERRLMAEVAPVLWLTHHDHLSVPFYQAFDNADPSLAANGDLLLGYGETGGAGARHSSGDQVRKALLDHQVDPDPYRWYIALKDEFPMQTAGFGLGIERWLQWVLSVPDIRDLQLVPRLNGVSLEP